MVVHALTASWLRFDMARYEAMPVGRSRRRVGTASSEKRDRRLATKERVESNVLEPGKGPVR